MSHHVLVNIYICYCSSYNRYKLILPVVQPQSYDTPSSYWNEWFLSLLRLCYMSAVFKKKHLISCSCQLSPRSGASRYQMFYVCCCWGVHAELVFPWNGQTSAHLCIVSSQFLTSILSHIETNIFASSVFHMLLPRTSWRRTSKRFTL